MEGSNIDVIQNEQNEKSLQNNSKAYDKNETVYELLGEVEQHNGIESKANIENVGKDQTEDEENNIRDDEGSMKSIIDKQNVANQDINEEEKESAVEVEEKNIKEGEHEIVEEEEAYVEEPPPDPAAPLNLRDSTEAFKPTFELRPDQIVEVEQLWELFQAYNPAYTDLDDYITEKELVYMLKSLLLMTYTSEQLQELIDYCVRPPHPEGHINYEQFLKIVTIRQRDLPIEDELRSALQALDPAKSGVIDREFMKDVLSKQGNKLTPKLLDNLIKEVDISNDGTIGIEDVVGTMCIDLNKDDIMMLKAALNPEPKEKNEEEL